MNILTYAYAFRVELPDGIYELVPQGEGHTTEGEVNLVDVQQDPDQSPDDLVTDFTFEGKPRSIILLFY